ncbi:unnamed protein product [Psylliodes chrysocephalus]|uniref:Dynein axonemal intermediate chain 4 n=1 Tax=Psylliodes chrysocephalus TaxID=3402493 RepID=A0A9P0DBJ0_9CUCU|nr:unnamed protein product [Psylliodes chrysocephala]
MFTTKHNECVGFESNWKVKRVYSSTESQTTEFAVAEQETSTAPKESIMIQTDSQPPPKLTEEVDMDKVAGFLHTIYPNLKKAIDDCNNSRAFRGYKRQSDIEEVECKLVQIVNAPRIGEEGDSSSKKVSSLTWNQSGKSLAFSCNFEHKSWCYHQGSVYIYTLLGNGKLPDHPKKTLTTESCVVSLKFHPIRPSVLAGSTYTGTVVIWNFQNDSGDEVIATKSVHDEVVTQILWTNDVDPEKTLLLVTTSTDGLLKLWRYDPNARDEGQILSLRTRYKVKPPLFNNMQKYEPDNDEEAPLHIITKESNGVVCFDFSNFFPDMFLVALEGGYVVQCSLLGATELKGSTKYEPLYDPSFKYYEPHQGEVISIAFSPNRKEQFMTYGTDSEIRIYLLGQEDPAQLIFLKTTLLDVTFVPFEDKLVAGCGLNGFMEIFHVQKATRIENGAEIPVKKRSVSTSLSINAARNNLVAIGSANGDIQLWTIPWSSLVNK